MTQDPDNVGIEIGMIGCGGHAQHHAQSLQRHFVIKTVWDPDPSAMTQIQSEKKAASLEELLSENISAVVICSPDKFHLPQIEMVLAHGKHVLCEKPLLVPGQDIARLAALLQLAKRRHLTFTSCHPRRFDKPALWLRERIYRSFRGLLGNVIGFSFDFSYHSPLASWKHSRSLLLDHISHEVDLMNFFFGFDSFNAWKLHDNYDQYEVVGQRDDEITFRFRGTRRLVSGKYPEWCSIRFERGEVKAQLTSGVIEVYDHENERKTRYRDLATDYDGRLEGVARDFKQSIVSGCPGYLSHAEMLLNTEAGIILQQYGIQRVTVGQPVEQGRFLPLAVS
jgi:myo-inositol 2-dehydrogenase/D-chiro-inositol 1-dehydrogenase